MKRILIILGIYGLCGIAYAQVGTWEVQIKNIGGANETGTGYFTINGNGTVSGYSLTTLTFGVPTYSGTWSTGAKGEILVMFSESLNGQNATGTFVGKFSTKSLKGKATFENGVRYSFNGEPLSTILDAAGNWTGTVKESGETVVESFAVTSNPDFAGIFDVSGLIGGSVIATGQVVTASNGTVSGYSIEGSVENTISGKANLSRGTLTTKGVDQNGNKFTGKFFKQ